MNTRLVRLCLVWGIVGVVLMGAGNTLAYGQGGSFTYIPFTVRGEPFPPDRPRAGYKGMVATAIDGDVDYYTVRHDGSEWTNLTDNALEDRYLQWSPDGGAVTYVNDQGAWLYNLRNNFRVVYANPDIPMQSATFSPDGTILLYTTGAGAWIVDTIVGTRTLVALQPATPAVFSPSSTYLYFQNGIDNAEWLLNTRTLARTRLATPHSLNFGFSPNSQYFLTYPNDEGKITVWNTADLTHISVGPPSFETIDAVVWAKGSRSFLFVTTQNRIRTLWAMDVADDAARVIQTADYLTDFDWAPDGQHLRFVEWDTAPIPPNPIIPMVRVLEPDGSVRTLATGYTPQGWLADGEQLLLQQDNHYFTVSLDDGEILPFSLPGPSDGEAMISPDTRQVIYKEQTAPFTAYYRNTSMSAPVPLPRRCDTVPGTQCSESFAWAEDSRSFLSTVFSIDPDGHCAHSWVVYDTSITPPAPSDAHAGLAGYLSGNDVSAVAWDMCAPTTQTHTTTVTDWRTGVEQIVPLPDSAAHVLEWRYMP